MSRIFAAQNCALRPRRDVPVRDCVRTHTVIMEKNRMSLFREVQLFLDEAK